MGNENEGEAVRHDFNRVR